MKKRSTKILIAALVATLMFSIFSGCKSKQKMFRESKLKEQSESTHVDSSRVLSNSSFNQDKLDSNNLALSSRASKTNSRILELHFQLDSNRNIKLLDTTGIFDLRQLINRGLASATSLIIKVQDQQDQSEENTVATNQISKQTNNQSTVKDSTGIKKAAEKKEVVKSEKEVQKKLDASVAKNFGGSWVVFGVITVALGLLLVFVFKR